jgi:two-component system, OmpR family, response regulator QseB
MASQILIIEDDLQLGDALVQALAPHGFDVTWVRNVHSGREFVASLSATGGLDGVLLDLQLPDGDGLTLLAELRAADDRLAVIVISARDTLQDRTRGLDLGADDYLVKPFEMIELVSRLRAVMRRAKGRAIAHWRVGALSIDTHRRLVAHDDGRLIELPRREFDLLIELVGNAGRVLTREQLEARLYRAHETVQSNALEVHVHGLRKKLGEALIKTVRGVGYLVEANE